MSKSEYFLNTEEEQEVINAIQIAEKNTSGEIRVHIEQGSETNAFERAKEVFHLLKMDNTKLQNGVLIYVAINNKSFAICGDKGINDVVSPDFWTSTKNIIQSHFKQGQFKQGLIEGILKTGEQLQKYFPWQKDDTNELSDNISTS
ncbi:MAG TPA: TPM domain-containing protein [Flavobacteriaceae bacterium]|jgi:uncharacterized membrane protein